MKTTGVPITFKALRDRGGVIQYDVVGRYLFINIYIIFLTQATTNTKEKGTQKACTVTCLAQCRGLYTSPLVVLKHTGMMACEMGAYA